MTEVKRQDRGGWGQARTLGDHDAAMREMLNELEAAYARGDRETVRWRAYYVLESLLRSKPVSGKDSHAAKLLRRLKEHGE